MTSTAALATLVLAAWLAALAELVAGGRRLRSLAAVDPATLPTPAPRVSVVVPARDEARHVRDAMRSLLALDHPALEVIAVDDRSTDGTGAILDALAAADPRLRVVHVAALPDGWLGKNHALHQGARAATGDWVLFTDADVYFAPDALRRAVAHAEAARLDHLVVGPRIFGGTVALRALLGTFGLGFALVVRPWRVGEPGRREHVGIGAFNLVRRRALDSIGGLSRLPLRPDDDIKLGKVISESGLAQGFLLGEDAVRVEWYRTVGEMVRGLEKNSFPFLDYSVARTLGACAVLALLGLWPLVALPWADGLERALLAASVALALVLSGTVGVRNGLLPWWGGALYPLGVALMIVTMLNSMVRTLAQGGVRWRGTLYPLAALKANRP